jgi:putative endonuclease
VYYVYLLQYGNEEKYYIGCTGDLKKRLEEHRNGKGCQTTKSVEDSGLWKLVYYEGYQEKSDATRREAKLKQYGSSRGHLKRRARDSIDTTDHS